jgi:type VI secretion system protein ImpH
MKTDSESLDLINSALGKTVYKLTLPVAVKLVMRILKEMFPDQTWDELYEKILFTTNPSLSFQKSDIKHIVFSKNDKALKVEMQLNFLSIFGASSPLPLHYSEKILEDAANKKILLDFLDMLNHRLKRLIYPIWERQRYYVQYENDLTDHFSKYILSILGLYPQSQNRTISLDMHKLLPFSGILAMHQKSTVSLLALLKHYFAHEEIEIIEGIISKSELPADQHVKLGDVNCGLGTDMCIGSYVLTRNLKFRILFENISWDALHSFSYYGEKKHQLEDLMRLVLKTPLSYEIAVTITPENIKPSILGENGTSLGVNGWIGQVSTPQTIIVATSN